MLGVNDTYVAALKNGFLLEPWRPAAHNAEAIQTAVADAGSDYIDFLQKRSNETFSFYKRLASCKTPLDFFQAYQLFLSKAAQDYQDEYASLAAIGKKALETIGFTDVAPSS